MNLITEDYEELFGLIKKKQTTFVFFKPTAFYSLRGLAVFKIVFPKPFNYDQSLIFLAMGELQGSLLLPLCLQMGTTRTGNLREIIFHAFNSPTSPLHSKTGLHVIATQSTEINTKPGEIPVNWCKD